MLIFSIAACSSKSEKDKTRYETAFLELFDTATRIVGYAVKEYHELYDIYNDYEGINNIKTINDKAGIAPVKVDRRIIYLLISPKMNIKTQTAKQMLHLV